MPRTVLYPNILSSDQMTCCNGVWLSGHAGRGSSVTVSGEHTFSSGEWEEISFLSIATVSIEHCCIVTSLKRLWEKRAEMCSMLYPVVCKRRCAGRLNVTSEVRTDRYCDMSLVRRT